MLIQKMNAVFKRQQKNPATQYKYSYWIVQYANFLQSAQLNGATSDKEKVHTFLLQADIKAAATKKQAISALRWLYKYILEKETPIPYRFIRPARKFPEFLTPSEVWSEMQKLSGTHQLMAMLFYGSGLSLAEVMSLKEPNIFPRDLLLHIAQRDIPLDTRAVPLYEEKQRANIRSRGTRRNCPRWVFPSRRNPRKHVVNVSFGMACKYHAVDVRFTPSTLRASFIVWAIRTHGIAQAQAWTELGNVRMSQYLEMSKHYPQVISPLDTLPGPID
ncbi:MAG: hypothetical protein GY801_52260 [bacterium]|nr:hypothetical protein [bacterium]